MVVGPIAFAYNIDGVDKLVLNAEVLAEIFKGDIKTWNDPKIAKLNSGAQLPAENITVFFRSDESGTTENTAKFLSKAGNGAWTDEPSKAWTGTGEGKNKSSGVAEATASTKNSISYMEWSYAKDNNLSMAQLDSGNGPVELTGESVGKAVAEAKVKGSGNDLSLDLKYAGTGSGAYPALLVTYEIVCSKGLAADKTAIVKDFLTYFSSPDSQSQLEELGYAPLPDRTAVEGPDGGRSDPVITSPRGGSSRRLTRDDPPPHSRIGAGRPMAVTDTDATERVEPEPAAAQDPSLSPAEGHVEHMHSPVPTVVHHRAPAPAKIDQVDRAPRGRQARQDQPDRGSRVPCAGDHIRFGHRLAGALRRHLLASSGAAQPAGQPGQLPHLA